MAARPMSIGRPRCAHGLAAIDDPVGTILEPTRGVVALGLLHGLVGLVNAVALEPGIEQGALGIGRLSRLLRAT